MSLTTAQLATLKQQIAGNPTLAAFLPDNPGGLAAFANTPPATGGTLLWRPGISVSELNTAIVWADFITLDQGHRDAYRAITQAGSVDATSAGIRVGFGSIFGSGASMTALTALAQRVGTPFETLFSTPVAGGGSVSAVFGQQLSVADILKAVQS